MAHKSERFVGKVAVLTAASEGIGLAIARRLGLEKAKVVVSSRNIDKVNNAVELLRKEGIDAIGVQCHVANAEERRNLLEEAVKHYGGIDILVSCAGVNPHYGSINDCSEAAFSKIFDLNVKCSFLIAKEVIPFMKLRGGGGIIFLSTIVAYKNVHQLSSYGASKICLSVLTKGFASALASDNIRVNCIAPGPIDTKFMTKIATTPEYKICLQHDMPIKRMGRVEEIAGPAAFLLSEDASYITGETLIVAGGIQSRI
ncbi:dehydrogenase/reductase SDR family member 4-like [Lutzomyia longipalpis]|uniref:dehydrogenase/reductase SDR family member 4-like n=1 Tax=Lutzomyia longipalpis TaxID=7200 RepID=UPI002484229A|nr:dehydrogenase/reductase SDR family member 4-like [Lutzomyia longipalpis]